MLNMATDESRLSITPYKRVLQLAHHPTKEEFKKVAMITGGISFAIGLIGMIVYTIMLFIPG